MNGEFQSPSTTEDLTRNPYCGPQGGFNGREKRRQDRCVSRSGSCEQWTSVASAQLDRM